MCISHRNTDTPTVEHTQTSCGALVLSTKPSDQCKVETVLLILAVSVALGDSQLGTQTNLAHGEGLFRGEAILSTLHCWNRRLSIVFV